MRKPATTLVSALHLLHRAAQRADALFALNAETKGLTPRQLAILQTAAENSGLSQAEIGASTGIDRSSTTDLVRRLIKNGSLQRRRSRKDIRAFEVRITLQGRRELEKSLPALKAANNQLLGTLSPAQRSAFLDALVLIAV
jgi:DNA-binding MarR family transcriptional regulator